MLEPVQKARESLNGSLRNYLRKVEAELKQLEDAARIQAKKEADERAMREAEALAAAGNEEAATRVIENAVNAPPPPVIVSAPPPQVKGMSVRRVWKARVVDESQVPREYLVVDQSKLDAVMKATKGSMKIPGVVAYEDTGFGHRS